MGMWSDKLSTKICCYLWAVIILLLLTTITACAYVNTIRIDEVNSYLDDLSKEHKEIAKVRVQQYAVYLQVKFFLNEDLPQELREDLFGKTKEYMLQDRTKELLGKKLGKERINELYSRLSIRFQNDKTQSYWHYHINLTTKEWELVTRSQNNSY